MLKKILIEIFVSNQLADIVLIVETLYKDYGRKAIRNCETE